MGNPKEAPRVWNKVGNVVRDAARHVANNPVYPEVAGVLSIVVGMTDMVATSKSILTEEANKVYPAPTQSQVNNAKIEIDTFKTWAGWQVEKGETVIDVKNVAPEDLDYAPRLIRSFQTIEAQRLHNNKVENIRKEGSWFEEHADEFTRSWILMGGGLLTAIAGWLRQFQLHLRSRRNPRPSNSTP